MQIIKKYFPNLTELQINRFELLYDLYKDWNEKINVISRKDIDNIYERHILHSLSIAKFYNLPDGLEVLDVGTGGGFPGIPLAIMFPNVNFHLIDSIQKKITVVNEVSTALNLENVTSDKIRSETINKKFDLITGRAVASIPEFLSVVYKSIKKSKFKINGILYLKGGDFDDEIKSIKCKKTIHNISDVFDEEFYETKKLIYLTGF